MKINKIYKMREIAGEAVIIKQGRAGSDITQVLSLNNTAKFLYENLYNEKDFSVEMVSDMLVKEYEIDAQTAEKDAKAWVDKLLELGVIEK